VFVLIPLATVLEPCRQALHVYCQFRHHYDRNANTV